MAIKWNSTSHSPSMGNPPNPALLIGLHLTPVSSICFYLLRALKSHSLQQSLVFVSRRESGGGCIWRSSRVCVCLWGGSYAICMELSCVSLSLGTAHVWSLLSLRLRSFSSYPHAELLRKKSLATEPDMSFTTEERGRPHTAEHRVFFSKSPTFIERSAKPQSYFLC